MADDARDPKKVVGDRMEFDEGYWEHEDCKQGDLADDNEEVSRCVEAEDMRHNDLDTDGLLIQQKPAL